MTCPFAFLVCAWYQVPGMQLLLFRVRVLLTAVYQVLTTLRYFDCGNDSVFFFYCGNDSVVSVHFPPDPLAGLAKTYTYSNQRDRSETNLT